MLRRRRARGPSRDGSPCASRPGPQRGRTRASEAARPAGARALRTATSSCGHSLEARGTRGIATADTLADMGTAGQRNKSGYDSNPCHPAPSRDLARRRRAHAVRQGRRPARRARRDRALACRSCRPCWASSTARTPDFVVWGTVVPNLTYSNIAREVLMDAGAPPTIPAFSTVMACSTSMIGAIEAAGMLNGVNRTLALVGGAESLSRDPARARPVAVRLDSPLQQARSLGEKVSHVTDLRARRRAPATSRRSATARPARAWASTPRSRRASGASRARGAGRDRAREPPARGRGVGSRLLRRSRRFPSATSCATRFRAATPRSRSSRSCRRRSTARAATGTLTAGNSSPLTDGAASVWVATDRRACEAARRTCRACGSSTGRSPRSICAARGC